MFLAKSIAQKSRALGIDELVFQDINETKLNIYGKMAQQVALRLNPELKFVLTSDPIAALSGADYVITTIRVGEDEMRVRDERIALDLGLLGQETTGAAGFSFAMRSIPALKEYCEIIKKYSNPCVKVFNFTNPIQVLVAIVLFVLVLYLGRETKKSLVVGIMLFCFIAILLGHTIEFMTVAQSNEVIYKAVTTSATLDLVFIFLSFISYLWVDDIEVKAGKKKSIDNSLEWFWNKV